MSHQIGLVLALIEPLLRVEVFMQIRIFNADLRWKSRWLHQDVLTIMSGHCRRGINFERLELLVMVDFEGVQTRFSVGYSSFWTLQLGACYLVTPSHLETTLIDVRLEFHA